MQVQANAACQRHTGFSAANRLAGLVKGHHGGRAGSIQRHAGAVQVKHVRQSIRGDAGGVASGGGGINRCHIVRDAIRVVEAGHAQKYPALAAAQGAGQNAGVFHGFPGEL